MKKINRLPREAARKLRIEAATGKVVCQVSPRWLQFPARADKYPDGTYLLLDVMTSSDEGKERKLCELVLIKEDLLRLIDSIPVNDRTT